MLKNFWTMEDIDAALSVVKSEGTIKALRETGALATNRWVLVTDCCAELFANPVLAEKNPEEAQFLGQVYRFVRETGYLCPREC